MRQVNEIEKQVLLSHVSIDFERQKPELETIGAINLHLNGEIRSGHNFTALTDWTRSS